MAYGKKWEPTKQEVKRFVNGETITVGFPEEGLSGDSLIGRFQGHVLGALLAGIEKYGENCKIKTKVKAFEFGSNEEKKVVTVQRIMKKK